MSKSKAELASDLLSAFMGEIHEITLSGGDVSLERKQSMKHLLAMKEQMERMFSKEEVIAIVRKSIATGLTAEYLILALKGGDK